MEKIGSHNFKRKERERTGIKSLKLATIKFLVTLLKSHVLIFKDSNQASMAIIVNKLYLMQKDLLQTN